MFELLQKPWPWYVSGPLIGLMVPALLLLGNKSFGLSSSLKHICAICSPVKVELFDYDWKKEIWNLALIAGIVIGGFITSEFLHPVAIISEETKNALNAVGITQVQGLAPVEIFNWQSILTLKGFILIIIGGFLVGFGTRYAEGCTSGHAIMGLSILSWPSLVATIAFFIGGLIMTHFVLPYILQL